MVALRDRWGSSYFIRGKLFVGPSGIGELVAVAVELEDDAERVFDVDHPVGLLPWEVFAYRHALPPASFDDPLGQSFDVRILHREVECAMALVLEFILGRVVTGELEELDANAIGSRHMRDLERAPPGAENVCTHDADGAVILYGLGGSHYDVEPEYVGVEFNGGVEGRNGQADVGKGAWCLCHL